MKKLQLFFEAARSTTNVTGVNEHDLRLADMCRRCRKHTTSMPSPYRRRCNRVFSRARPWATRGLVGGIHGAGRELLTHSFGSRRCALDLTDSRLLPWEAS